MREGTRKAIFTALVKEIPFGTNRMVVFDKAKDTVEQMLIEDYEDDCRKFFLERFSDYITQGDFKKAKTVEEYLENDKHGIFKTVGDALKWSAEAISMKELNEGVKWLIQNGYMRESKQPVRFGYRWCLGITHKGWEVAHLYK